MHSTAIVVEYEILEPLLDPEAAIDGSHPPIHPDGNLIRHQRIVCGDTTVTGAVVVEGTYDIGMQDQAFLGLEAALAVPDPGGDGRRTARGDPVAARGPHQIAACLGLPDEAGSADARGRRRSVRCVVRTSACRCTPACWRCALGRPVRIAYCRERELPRARAPPPGDDLDASPRDERRRDRQDRGALRVRRRRVRVDVVGGADQRHHPDAGAVPLRQRRGRRLRGAHQPPALWGDARFRCGAGVLRPRVADGPARRGAVGSPRRDAPAQRDADRRRACSPVSRC